MTRFKSYANRGMQLEKEVEITNKRYNHENIAKVQKIPTPVKVLSTRGSKITKAFYEKKSTVDYIGTYEGRTIVFDAKETNVETRFDLKNIKQHQYQYLKEQHECGAVAFLIVRFKTLDETYFLRFELLSEYMENMREGGRKSIPYDVIQEECELIERDGYVLLDYIENIKEVE